MWLKKNPSDEEKKKVNKRLEFRILDYRGITLHYYLLIASQQYS